MRIVALLVFDEVIRRRQFSDVVVKSANARQQRIRAYRAGRLFRQLANCVRMLICAGRSQRQLAEYRQVRV